MDDLTAAFASGLFSGVGGGKLSSQGRAPQRKQPAPKFGAPAPTTPSPVSNSIYSPPAPVAAPSEGSLFTGLGVEEKQQSIFGSTTVVSGAPALSSASLLGDRQPTYRPAAQQPQARPGGSINLLDLDFNAPPPTSTDTSSFGLLDPSIFGDLTGQATTPTSAVGGNFGFFGASDNSLQFK